MFATVVFTLVALVSGAGLLAVPATPQGPTAWTAHSARAPVVTSVGVGPPCSGPGWTIHDDGTPENGISLPLDISDGIFLDRFALGAGSGKILSAVCVRLIRFSTDSVVDGTVTIWTLDGPGAEPNELLGSVPVTATGVPTSLPGQFYEVDVSPLGIPAQGDLGVGFGWNPTVDQDFFLLIDETNTTVFTNPMWSPDGGVNWDELVDAVPTVRTMFIRVKSELPVLIFADGFESGDTASWSATVP